MARSKKEHARELEPLGDSYKCQLTGLPIYMPPKGQRGRGRPRDHINATARKLHARLHEVARMVHELATSVGFTKEAEEALKKSIDEIVKTINNQNRNKHEHRVQVPADGGGWETLGTFRSWHGRSSAYRKSATQFPFEEALAQRRALNRADARIVAVRSNPATRWRNPFAGAPRVEHEIQVRKNPNPSAKQLDRAQRACEAFRWDDPCDLVSTVTIPPTPDIVWELGPVVSVTYEATKRGEAAHWEHHFKDRRPVLAFSEESKALYFIGGDYKVNHRGIVG